MNTFLLRLLLIASALCCCSCGSLPTPGSAGFLSEPERMDRNKQLPFKKSWDKSGINPAEYNALKIVEVSAEHLETGRRRSDRKLQKRDEDVAELAEYARTAFEEAIRNDKTGRIHLANSSSDPKRTLICELAIVEFEPNSPLAMTVAYGLGVSGRVANLIALSGSSTVLKGIGIRGRIAIELRLRDAHTGETIFMFADRERGRASIVNVKDFGRTLHARARLRTWAKQTVTMITNADDRRIRDPFILELKPW